MDRNCQLNNSGILRTGFYKYLIQKVMGLVYLRKETCDMYETWPWPLSCRYSIFDIEVSMAAHCMTN